MKTVVILGAGASADFGLPLGDALYGRAADLLRAFIGAWKQRAKKDAFWRYDSMVAFVNSEPRFRPLLPRMLGKYPGGQSYISLEPIEQVLEAMEVAPAYSLDTLALEYPEYSEIFRTLCSYLIVEAISERIVKDDRGIEQRLFDRRVLIDSKSKSERSNWIHLFCSMVRNELASDQTRKYGIVSFNYDRLFEKVGSSIWKKPSRTLGGFDDVFQIKYPHGKIHWETDSQDRSVFEVEKSSIVFAHNKPGQYTNDGAAELVASAEKLVFLGFHFSPENIATLQLAKCSPALCVYQNFSGNRGLDSRVQSLGFKNVQMFTGSISDAILQGELGQLPS